MTTTYRPTVLITGASGFVGSHLVEAALNQGFDTWAGVRATSSRQYLTDRRTNFITLNLDDPTTLSQQLTLFCRDHHNAPWDYVIHAAGATKAPDEATFDQANYLATRNLVDALVQTGLTPKRLVFVSSLSAVTSVNGQPTTEPAPTAYGRSKFRAEQYLQSLSDRLDYIILRPTGIYGPRERDYMLAIKSIDRHIDIAIGREPQKLSFIYVKDVCKAALSALTQGQSHHVYALSDGETYTNSGFSRLVQQNLHKSLVAHITIPLWLLHTLCQIGQALGKLTGHSPLLNNDKYYILKQRDWTCNSSEAQADLHFKPDYDLAKGLRETISWYKQQQ